MSEGRLRRFLPLFLIIFSTLIFFRQMTFSDLILARGDTYNYFYPYWDVRNAAFRAGELPLWTTDLFMGAPLLANPQLGAYYPLNWLTAPFRAPQAIKISILLHSILAGLGVFYLYREAVEKRILPALLAALVYSFSGYLGAHVEQINQFQGLAWLPILFTLYHRTLTRGRPWRDGLLFALAWALQIFCGHTQTVFISGIGLGVYGIGLGMAARETPGQIGRRLLTLAVCTLVALLLAMPQLLPSLELIGMSNRGSGFSSGEATAFSLSPNLLGRALLPSYDGQLFGEYVAYVGVIGLGSGALGRRGRPSSRRQATALDRHGASGFASGAGTLQPALFAAGGIARFQPVSRAGALPGIVHAGHVDPGGYRRFRAWSRPFKRAGAWRPPRRPGSRSDNRCDHHPDALRAAAGPRRHLWR